MWPLHFISQAGVHPSCSYIFKISIDLRIHERTQNVLLLLIALPSYTAFMHGQDKAFGASPLDFVGTALVLGLVTMETVADQQQWNFHAEKLAKKYVGYRDPPCFIKR